MKATINRFNLISEISEINIELSFFKYTQKKSRL